MTTLKLGSLNTGLTADLIQETLSLKGYLIRVAP